MGVSTTDGSPLPIPDKCCRTCANWFPPAEQGEPGTCRPDYPKVMPMQTPMGSVSAAVIWAPMLAHEWCRKWERRYGDRDMDP